jgi:hypothetical protein
VIDHLKKASGSSVAHERQTHRLSAAKILRKHFSVEEILLLRNFLSKT